MKKIWTILFVLISLSSFSQNFNCDSAIKANRETIREKQRIEDAKENARIYQNIDSTKQLAKESWIMVNDTAKKIGWKRTIQVYWELSLSITIFIILFLLYLKGKKI